MRFLTTLLCTAFDGPKVYSARADTTGRLRHERAVMLYGRRRRIPRAVRGMPEESSGRAPAIRDAAWPFEVRVAGDSAGQLRTSQSALEKVQLDVNPASAVQLSLHAG
jgi:hypothetical protein